MAAPHSIGKEGLEEKRHEEVSQARRALQEGPEAPGSMGSFHFDWDLNAMPAGDRVGWELWEQASYLYLLVWVLLTTFAPSSVWRRCLKSCSRPSTCSC